MMRGGLWTTVLAGAFAPTLAWAQRDPDFYGHPMMWGGWYGMFFGLLTMILFIPAVVVLVVFAVRWFGGPGLHPHAPPPKTPLDILKERFARGEIDKDEFDERRRLLSE
jgi:putative membrane protein